MEKRTRFNLLYLAFALIAATLLQSWWQQAQTVEVVPYSEFEKLLAEDKIAEVVVSDQRITGKLKAPEGGKTVVVANLVPARPRRAAVQVRRQVHARAREHVPARPPVVGGAGAGVLRRLVPARAAHGRPAGRPAAAS